MRNNKLLLCCICFTSMVNAAEISSSCKSTKEAMNDYEPEKFQTTNNLLKSTGQTPIYCGERIIIHGRILDNKCHPISDAKIYSWQVDCSGNYPYKPLKNRINKSLIKIDPDLTFTGNGVAVTNKKGEFYFITVYPGIVEKLPPHINFRVRYKDSEFQTKIPLKGKKNKKEYHDDFSDLYEVEIVLPD